MIYVSLINVGILAETTVPLDLSAKQKKKSFVNFMQTWLLTDCVSVVYINFII